MKKSIKKSLFETNSSSVHTLVISSDGMEESHLPVRKDGYIHVPLRYYGREGGVYTEQMEKLSYICTRAVCGGNGYSWDFDSAVDDIYVLEMISDAIEDYTGHKIKVYVDENTEESDYYYDEPYGFDHQTYPEYSDDMNGFCNVYDPESIQSFVFNKYVSFTTGSD